MKNIISLIIYLLAFTSCDNKAVTEIQNIKTKNVVILFSYDLSNLHENSVENESGINYKIIYLTKNTINSFKKVLEDKNIDVIISFLESQDMLTIQTLIEEAKIPIVATIASHKKINEIKYVTRICLNDQFEGYVAASFLRDELFISHLSVLKDSRNIFSKDLTDIFMKRYIHINGTIDNIFDTDLLLNNKVKFITELKESNVKTIYAVADSYKMKQFLKIIKDEKLDIKVLSNDGLLSSFKLKYPQDLKLLNGVLVVDNYADDVVYGNTYDALIYDAKSLIKEAFNNCKEDDNECINAYMRDIDDFQASLTKISIHNGNAYRTAYINEINHNKMNVILKVN